MTAIIPDQQPLPRRSASGMHSRTINAAAGLLQAAKERGCSTSTGQAIDLDSAGLLNSPEHAAEFAQMKERLAALEAAPATDGVYPPALPWAALMDHEDLTDFLYELAASAIAHATAEVALVEVEATCGRWRMAEAQHAHNTAPGPDEAEQPIAYALTDAADELRSCCAGPVCTCTPLSPQDDEYIPPNDDAPARQLPAITVTCPYCAAKSGDLCTSDDNRTRSRDVHQHRTLAWQNAEQSGGARRG